MFWRLLFAGLMFLSLSGCLSGCNATYYLKSGYNQLKLMNAREDVSKVLQREDLSEVDRKKILRANEARVFAEEVMGLRKTKNYTSFVQLDRPYVNYALSAAPKWQLEHYRWDFLIVGKVPYKGFFNEAEGKAEEQKLIEQGYDTYLRGVAAYSTLGWFRDPLLSSMMRYSEYDLVNTVIHETVHATLFIKSSADFNERLATFLGNKGAEAFYLKAEGANSETLKRVSEELEDEKLFGIFITEELKQLEEWYKSNASTVHAGGMDEAVRAARLKEIQTRFVQNLKPKLKSKAYDKFPDRVLNNAYLNVYKTYLKDHSEFERLWQKVGGDFHAFLKACIAIEDAEDPEVALKALSSPK
jgi:predicted aminopeptidase